MIRAALPFSAIASKPNNNEDDFLVILVVIILNTASHI